MVRAIDSTGHPFHAHRIRFFLRHIGKRPGLAGAFSLAVEQRQHGSFGVAYQVEGFGAVGGGDVEHVHDRFDLPGFDAGGDQAVSARCALPRAAGEDAERRGVAGPHLEVVVVGEVVVIVVGLFVDLLAQGGELFGVCPQLLQLFVPLFGVFVRIGRRRRRLDQPPRRFREVFAL